MKWTEEEVAILKNNGANMYAKDLMKLLPDKSLEGIAHKLKRLKIRKTMEFWAEHGKKTCGRADRILLPRYKLDQQMTIDDLDNTTYQVLIGSLLGDGGITNQNRNQTYIFKETHGYAQKNYVLWKHRMLSTFMPSKPSCLDTKPIFSTPSHPIFKQLRQEWYNEQEWCKAYIPMQYVDRLNILGLLIWYLDDGHKLGSSGFDITSSLFTENNLLSVVETINNKLSLSLYICKKKPLPPYKVAKLIRFNAENKRKILPLWKQLFQQHDFPECMRYKIEI